MKHGIRGANLKHENMPMKDIEMWPEGFLFLWPKASLTGCNYEAVCNKTSNSAAFYHRPIGTYRSCQGFLGSIWIWHRDAFLLLSLTPPGQRCFQLLVNHYFAQILGIAAQIPADKPDDKYAIWIWGENPSSAAFWLFSEREQRTQTIVSCLRAWSRSAAPLILLSKRALGPADQSATSSRVDRKWRAGFLPL